MPWALATTASVTAMTSRSCSVMFSSFTASSTESMTIWAMSSPCRMIGARTPRDTVPMVLMVKTLLFISALVILPKMLPSLRQRVSYPAAADTSYCSRKDSINKIYLYNK